MMRFNAQNSRPIYGRGIGSIFKVIFGLFKPLLNIIRPTAIKLARSGVGKQLIKSGKQAALDGVLSTTADILQGDNVKNSVAKNFKKTSRSVANSITKLKSKKTSRKGKRGIKHFFD